jgi:nicotinamidase-related amidase
VTPETPAINPANAALLIMDYQPAVLGAFPDSEALLARVERAISAAREHHLLVGYIRVGFDDDDYANLPETNTSRPPTSTGNSGPGACTP